MLELETLVNRVKSKFSEALDAGSLTFSETHSAILHNATKVQLRYCPALAEKLPKQHKDKPSRTKFDPFDKPSPDLLVTQIPHENPTHNILLNKYPIIRNHFILATKENKSQTDLLEVDDLSLAYACVRAWKKGSQHHGSLYAFFNSGEHSGASQPHRHLQFLPVEDIGSRPGDNWDLLCNSMTSSAHPGLPLLYNPMLPFVHFAMNLEVGDEGPAIHEKYIVLLEAVLASISYEGLNILHDAVSISLDLRASFSYNLAITSNMMAILPRKAEGAFIHGTGDNYVSVNGTVLAGTLMVRSEEAWDHLRQEPELIRDILSSITYTRPRPASSQKQDL